MIRSLLFTILTFAVCLEPAMADKLPAAAIQQKKYSKLIVGKWQGSKCLELTFSSDGLYAIDSSDESVSTQHAKGRWRIEGNQLIIDFSDGKHSVSQIEYVREKAFALQGRHHSDVFDRISH